ADFVPRYYNEKAEWLVPGWLPERTIAFVVSPPGHFKTMLTFDLAVSVAGAFPFLGKYPVQRPGPVLVIQQEDSYGDMANRFNRIFGSRIPDPILTTDPDMAGVVNPVPIPPVHICMTRGFSLTPASLRKLEDLI